MALVLKQKTDVETGSKTYPMAAIRDGVIFPHVEVVLTFGRSQSVRAVRESFNSDREIIFVSQKKASVVNPKQSDLYHVGVLAKIERTLKTNDEINALVTGVKRVKIDSVDASGPYLKAQVTELPDLVDDTPELEALSKHLLNEFKKSVNLGKGVEFLNFMKLMSGVQASELVDQIATTLDASTEEKQAILEMNVVKDRILKVIEHLSHEVKVLQIEKNIASKTQKKFDKSMREAVLRERLKTIQSELGDSEAESQEVDDLKKKILMAKMPKKTESKVLKELRRFEQISVHSPEHSYIRSWLETVVEMPWNVRSKGEVSITRAAKVLNRDHYGIEEVKERIIEYLSVLKLKRKQKSTKDRKVPTILCFVGPPGVGKTSMGRSIAKSLGREFAKLSLGGMRDEAEIRGHRRTYVGAMPGRIIQSIRHAGKKNPVFMLDEIDKIGSDFRGDPSSALLEALDPEQNHEFSDHYLEVPFDLSEVIFITTANVLSTIPAPLLDRLEIIEFSGYTLQEKYQIARKHLMEKTLQANALEKDQVIFTPESIRTIVSHYTREAGVRNLEREISKVMRKVAKKVASGLSDTVTVTPQSLADYLGPRKYTSAMAEQSHDPGLATGLAWTQVGGDIIFIEVSIMPGKGKVQLTGKLGDVMQESAKAAWSYVRSHWKELKLEEHFYKEIDVHIHVPEGAVPKDGPSAGITMVTAMVSALTKRSVKTKLGMTGEVTLRGRVLEIGGLKEKVIAAHRAGIRTIIAPKNNKKDLVKIPDALKKDITFHFVDTVDSVLDLALSS